MVFLYHAENKIHPIFRPILSKITMNTCIYSKATFNDSAGEHVLQNFLGARWVSTAIVCNTVQDEFGKTIDVSFEQGLKPFRNLLGTKGGRGESGPTLKGITTTSSKVLNLEPGGKPQIAKPIVTVILLPDGNRQVRIILGTISQLGWALVLLREQIPNLKVDINQIKSLAQSGSGFISDQALLDFAIGGKDYFRGLLKSCMNLLGACDSILALNPCFDPVRSFVLHGTGETSEFARWSMQTERLPIPSLGKADHFVAIASIRGRVQGFVQLFGNIIHPIQLAQTYSDTPFQYGYLVNPFRDTSPAEIRNPQFDISLIPSFVAQAASPGQEYRAALKTRVERLLALSYDIADHELVSQAIDEILKPEEGRPFTSELADRFSQRLSELFAHRDFQKI